MWVYQAEAYRKLGDYNAAKKHINEALRINPERTSAHILAGLLHCEGAQIDQALKRWDFIQNQIPSLCRHNQVGETPRPDGNQLHSVFENMLDQMNGNRASTVITWMHQGALHLTINDPNDVTAQYGL